jgi:hypothetical protein
VYSLSVLLWELIALRHPRADKRSVADMLAAVVSDADLDFWQWSKLGHAACVPSEIIHIVRRGMKRDAGERFQSVDELLEALARVRDQRVAVQCQYTLVKRGLGAIDHGLARNPRTTFIGVALGVLFALIGVWSMVEWFLRG